jgi:general stress protein 26
MSKEEIDTYLSGRLVARIATVGADGIPAISPVWYYWDGECLYIVMKTKRRMAKNLVRNPWCSVVIDTDDRLIWGMWDNRARGVMITGRAEIHRPEDQITISAGPWKDTYPVLQARKLLLKRYQLGPEQGALGIDPVKMQAALEQAQQDPGNLLYQESEEYCIAKIRPEKIRAWDFSKAAPKDSVV